MPTRKRGKRSRSHDNNDGVDGPLPPPTTHIIALTTTRDAIVTFGAGYGALSVPVERRIARYLRQERVYAVGGYDEFENPTRNCYSLDAAAGVWVAGAPMTEDRSRFGLVVFHGDLLVVGCGTPVCLRLAMATDTWAPGPDITEPHGGSPCVAAVFHGELWVVGIGIRENWRLNAVTNQWVRGPWMAFEMILA